MLSIYIQSEKRIAIHISEIRRSNEHTHFRSNLWQNLHNYSLLLLALVSLLFLMFLFVVVSPAIDVVVRVSNSQYVEKFLGSLTEWDFADAEMVIMTVINKIIVLLRMSRWSQHFVIQLWNNLTLCKGCVKWSSWYFPSIFYTKNFPKDIALQMTSK